MERIDPVLVGCRPDWVVVYGDVNSTMAASLVATKLRLRVAHVEAGLRSYDRAMPEEINRIVTDRLADLLLTPSRDAAATLLREGCSLENIEFVGNVMIDSLHFAMRRAQDDTVPARFGVNSEPFAIVTLHRPSNVDDPGRLQRLVEALATVAGSMRIMFFAHPRTRAVLEAIRVPSKVEVHPPATYPEMVNLLPRAAAVITDSGGLQEETTALGVPCITVRRSTERPITISEGTNRLVPEPEDLPAALFSHRPSGRIPEGWDGCAGERVVAALMKRPRAAQ